MEEGKGYGAGLINRCIIKPGTGISGGRVSRNPMQLNIFFCFFGQTFKKFAILRIETVIYFEVSSE